MALSIREAAKEAGVSKSTIFRAIQRGRLSADRDADGNCQIQPSELFRVYPPRTDAVTSAPGQGATPSDAALKAEIEGLRAQLQLMREKDDELINELKVQRDGWQRQAETATRLLTDQRPHAADKVADSHLNKRGSNSSDQRPARGLFGFLKRTG